MVNGSPARARISSTRQRGRATPGTGKGAEGRTDTRQRVIAAVGWPKSAASACRRQRRRARPRVPDALAARCSRREAVIESRATSATTAVKRGSMIGLFWMIAATSQIAASSTSTAKRRSHGAFRAWCQADGGA